MIFLRILVVFLILLNVSFTQSFTLSEDGYHQVDFPLSSSLVDVDSYLSTQELSSSIDIMWTHDGNEWKYWAPEGDLDTHNALSSYSKIQYLKLGHGYLVKTGSEGSVNTQTESFNSVELKDTLFNLISFNLDTNITPESLFSKENLSTKEVKDIAEVWMYNSSNKSWSFYSGDSADTRYNSYEKISSVAVGQSLWVKSKTGGLKISLSSQAPVFTVSGTSSLTPPSVTSNSTFGGTSIASVDNQQGKCKFDATDDEAIGTASLYTIDNDLISQSPVYCPTLSNQSITYNLEIPAEYKRVFEEKPSLAKNLVIKVKLNSGQEEKAVYAQDLLALINSEATEVKVDTDSKSTFVSVMFEMQMAQKLGIAADQVELAADEATTNAVETIDLSSLIEDNEDPIDMLRFQELIDKVFTDNQNQGQANNYISDMITTIGNLNDPSIDPTVRQSSKSLFVTTPQNNEDKILEFVSKSFDLISSSIEAEKEGILEDNDESPVNICLNKMLNTPSDLIDDGGASRLLDACAMVEENVDLAVSLVGDVVAKEAALANIETLKTNLNSEKLAQILTGTDQFELLNLTLELVSFPQELIDRMSANIDASEALAKILGQSAEMLAEAQAFDSQSQLVNDTRKLELLKAIEALQKENDKLSVMVTAPADPKEIVKRLADYIVGGGDPSKIGEVSEFLDDNFPDGAGIDYAALIDRVRLQTPDPTEIILGLLKTSDDPLFGTKVLAEASTLLTEDQLRSILNDKEISSGFQFERNIFVIAGKDRKEQIVDAVHNFELNGSRSFDPKGETSLQYTWQEIDKFGGEVLTTFTDKSASAVASVSLSAPDGFRYFRLTVNNGDESRVNDDEIRINFYQDPEPVIVFNSQFLSAGPSDVVTFDVTDSFYPDGGDIDSFTVEQINGPAQVGLTQSINTLFSFQSADHGEYQYKIIATKVLPHITKTSEKVVTIQIEQYLNPVAHTGLSAQILVGDTHTFTNRTFSPNKASLTYTWSPATYLDNDSVKEPTFTPILAGVYDFTLVVTDSNGLSSQENVRITAVDAYAPLVVAQAFLEGDAKGSPSVIVNFRETSADSVNIELNSCLSSTFALDKTTADLIYTWDSVDYDFIENPNDCKTSITISKTDYLLKTVHHFSIKIEDGINDSSGTVNVVVIPEKIPDPEIVLEYFQEKSIYLAGEELDIEAWQSYSYHEKPLAYSWIPLDQKSRVISRSYTSRFSGQERDSLELSIPADFGTTNTGAEQYRYQLTVTEKNPDQTFGQSSTQIVKINAYMVCPTPALISKFNPSQTRYQVIEGQTPLFEIDSDYRALCYDSSGNIHPIVAEWILPDSFIETQDSTAKHLVTTIDFEQITAPTELTVGLQITDQTNGQVSLREVIVEFVPVDCELDVSFVGKEKDEAGYYHLVPEVAHLLSASIDCSDSESTYADVNNQFTTLSRYTIDGNGTPGTLGQIEQFAKTSSKPSFNVTALTTFASNQEGTWGINAASDGFDGFADKFGEDTKVIVAYLPLQPAATIVERITNDGVRKQILSHEYEEYSYATSLDFILTANGSFNPNVNPGSLSYTWSVSDATNISFASTNTETTVATISGLDFFTSNTFNITLTVSDSSNKAKDITTDIKIVIHRENYLPNISNLQVTGSQIYNSVSFTYVLTDGEGEHSAIQFEYTTGSSEGAGEWSTSAYVSTGFEPITTVYPGNYKGLVWDSHKDIGAGQFSSVQVRLTPIDPYGRLGGDDLSKTFVLLNPKDPNSSAIIEDRICHELSGDSVENVFATTYNGGCVTSTIDFHVNGDADPHPYKDSFRYEWGSNSTTPYWFIPEVEHNESKWFFGEDAQDGAINLGGISYKDKLYFWGGSDLKAENLKQDINIYDVKNDSWSTGTSGGTARRYHTAVESSGKVYFYGGRYGSLTGELDPIPELSASMDVYDIEGNSWTSTNALSIEIAFYGDLGVVHEGKIYHYGAWTPQKRGLRTKNDFHNDIYIYDIGENTWTQANSTGAPSYDELEPLTKDYSDGKIYYSGRQSPNHVRKVWVFDILANSWDASAPANLRPFNGSVSSASFDLQDLPSNGGTVADGTWPFSKTKGFSIAPAMDALETKIYLGGDKFYAVDRLGNEIGAFAGNGASFSSPAIYSDPRTPVSTYDENIYVNQQSKILWGLKHDTDTQNFTVQFELGAAEAQAQLGAAEYKRLTAGKWQIKRPAVSRDGYLYAPGGKNMYKISPDGKIVWVFQTKGTCARAVIDGFGNIYFGSSDRNIYSLAPNKKVRWITKFDKSAHVTRVPSIGLDGTIYVNGKYLAGLDGETGELTKWRYRTDSQYTPFIGPKGVIYATSLKQGLISLYPDGSVKWIQKGRFRDNPVVGDNGIVYVGNEDKNFYAFSHEGKLMWKFKANGRIAAFPNLTADGVLHFVAGGSLYAVNSSSKHLNDSSWPVFQGDNQNSGRYYRQIDDKAPGVRPTEPETSEVKPGDIVFNEEVCDGSINERPALSDKGVLYAICAHRKSSESYTELFAYNTNNTSQDRVLWRFRVNNRARTSSTTGYFDSVAISPLNNDIVFTTAVESDYTYGDDKGIVFVIDPVTGTPKNKVEVENIFYSDFTFYSRYHTAIARDGAIIVGTNRFKSSDKLPTGYIQAFDESLEKIWTWEGAPIYHSPVIGADDSIYFYTASFIKPTRNGWPLRAELSHIKSIHALSKNGERRWVKTLVPTKKASKITLGKNGTLYFATLENQINALDYFGNKKWSTQISKFKYSTTIQYWASLDISVDKDDNLYLAADGRGVNSDLSHSIVKFSDRGEIVWRFTSDQHGGALNQWSGVTSNNSKSMVYQVPLFNHGQPEWANSDFAKGLHIIDKSDGSSKILTTFASNGSCTPNLRDDGLLICIVNRYIGASLHSSIYGIQTDQIADNSEMSWARPGFGNKNTYSQHNRQFTKLPPNPADPEDPRNDNGDEEDSNDNNDDGIPDEGFPGDGNVPKPPVEDPNNPGNGSGDGSGNGSGDGGNGDGSGDGGNGDGSGDGSGNGDGSGSQPPSDGTTDPSNGGQDGSVPGNGSGQEPIGPTRPPEGGFPGIRGEHASILVDGKIYFYGGTIGFDNGFQSSYSNTVDIYDIKKDEWFWGVPAPVGRGNHAGVKYKGDLYFFGGTDGNEEKATLEIFKPAFDVERMLYRVTNTPIELTHQVSYKSTVGLDIENIQIQTKYHSSNIYNNKLFVIGGENDSSVLKDAQVFNLSSSGVKTSQYTFPSLIFNRSHHASAVWKNILFVVGGQNDDKLVKQVEVYDLLESGAILNASYDFKLPGDGLMNHSLEVIGDKLFVIGGQSTADSSSATNAILVYDLNQQAATPSTESLTNVLVLDNARALHSSAVYNNILYVMGGTNSNDLKSVEAFDFTTTNVAKLDSSKLPNLYENTYGHATSVFKDKILISGGVSDGTHNDTLEVLEKVPSVVNSNLQVRHHPSFGVASLTQKREGHSSNVYNDLFFVIGGKGTKWPSTLIEAYKLSNNNIQAGILSASDTAEVTFTLQQLVPQSNLTKPEVFDLSGDVDGDGNTVYNGDLQIVFDMSLINEQAQTSTFSTEVYLEYSEDSGLTWLIAQPITKSEDGEELTSMSIGANKEIIWDSTVLFPGNYQNIVVRVKTINGSVSEKSDPFDILNSPEYAKNLPIITNLRIIGSELDGRLHLAYTIADGNNENSTIEVYFFNGDEEEEIETILDISPGNKTYTWNSRDNLQAFLANTYIRMLPSDGKTLEEGIGDTTQEFDCPNGGIAFGDVVISAICNTNPMGTVDDIYLCGADQNGSNAVWTLDATSTVSENNGAPLSYTWELVEDIDTVAITNANASVATLTINDPGEVTSANQLRSPLVKLTITEASNSYISYEETLNLTLQKPDVIASGFITNYLCDHNLENSVIAIGATSMTAGCTEATNMVVQLDGSSSTNPNASGLTHSWSASGGTVVFSDTSITNPTATITLADSEAEVVITLTVQDSPNAIYSNSNEFSLNVQKFDEKSPTLTITNVEVNEVTGFVDVTASVADETNGDVISVDFTNMFAVKGVNFTPTGGTISGLQPTYAVGEEITFSWDSQNDTNVSTLCSSGIQIGLQVSDQENHTDSAQSASFDLFNCGGAGMVSGIVAIDGVIDTGAIGYVELKSLGGEVLSTGSLFSGDGGNCNLGQNPQSCPNFQLPLSVVLKSRVSTSAEILDNAIYDVKFNSGQYQAMFDTTDRSASLASATADNITTWGVTLNAEETYFYYFLNHVTEKKLNTPEFFGVVESDEFDVTHLKATLDRGYVSTDDFYIGTQGFVHKAVRMFEDSDKGINHTTNADNRELEFNGFFDQTPGKNLTFTNTQHQKTLIETYSTLNDLIQERKSYPATATVTPGDDSFNVVAILDATISKLMKVGAPGTDGVEGDGKSGDANNLCNPDRFSIAIANILQNTISIADAAQGTAFEFEGEAKLNQILAELDAFKNSGPINCAESELTITRLIAESMQVSDDFLDAIAKDTQAALAMANTLGMANAAIGAQTSIEKQGLSTDLADITELDAYLAKLEAANQKLKDMAKSAIDEDLLADMLAESLKESSKSTGGTIGMIGLIKGLEEEFAQSGGSFSIGFENVLEKAVGSNDVNRRDFVADILKQEENDGLATEILAQLSDDLSREEIQFLIDDKFAQEGSQPRVIFVNFGKGGMIDVKGDSHTLSLDASDHYDPQDPEKTDTYEYTWTIHHENPNIESRVFSNSTSTIDLEFLVTEDFIETDPMEISLDLEGGAARVVELNIRNINTNSTTQNTRLQYIFTNMLPPVVDAGKFEALIEGSIINLDGSNSYAQGATHGLVYKWTILEHPPVENLQGDAKKVFDADQIKASFNSFAPGLYTFELMITAVDENGNSRTSTATVKKQIFDFPPLSADAGLNTVIAPNSDYVLTNSSFAVNMAGLTYLWSPSDNLTSATTRAPVFKTSAEGQYELTLQITDENNRVSSDTVTITVQDKKAPFVTAGNSQTVSVGATNPAVITLDGGPSFSYLADKQLSYAWVGMDDLNNDVTSSIVNSNQATATYTIQAGITRPSKTTFTLTVTDSLGKTAIATSFVRALPTVLGPVLIVEKDPIRTLYRSGDTLKLKLSKSYSRSGLFLDFEYKQLSGPDVASFYYSPSGTHRENNDIATITLPEFEEDLVSFTFLVSAIDVEPSTGYPDITTSSQIVTINAVPLLRKPLIRDVPDRLEVRLSLPTESPTTFTIDASNSRTLDHDGNDLRNPIGFSWTPSLPSNLLSILNSTNTSPAFEFTLNQNDPAFLNIQDKYEATILLEVTDQNTGKTEQKTIILWIYPPFHPVAMDLVFVDLATKQPGAATHAIPSSPTLANPFYDDVTKQWIFKQNTDVVQIDYNATWDNTSNVAASTLSSSNIYGAMRILSQIDQNPQTVLFDYGTASGQSTGLVTHVTNALDYTQASQTQAYVLLNSTVDKTYTLEMQASIANGLQSTKAFPLRIINNWDALSSDPEITQISAGSNTITTSEKTQPQPTVAIQAKSAVITIDLKASNTNGGGLNYTIDPNTLGNGVAGSIVHKGNGIVEITLPSIPERNQNGSGTSVSFNYQIFDTLGRTDLATTPKQIKFFIYRDHSKPTITIVDSTVKVINNDYIEFNYNLVDPDGDVNAIEFNFGSFVGDVDTDLFVKPRSTEGDFNVSEGNNYYVRWYFPQDGSFFIDSRLKLKIRLSANDGSYHGVQYSNISDVPEIILSNSIDSELHGVLSVEGETALAGSIFVESEPNNVYHSKRESVAVQTGDHFTIKGENSHEADIRDSFTFELDGASTFKITSSKNDSGADFGIFDRKSQKFVQFYFDHSKAYKEFVINPQGGIRTYDFVIFNLDIDATYEFDIDFTQADFTKLVVTNEIEPNNTQLDAQFLGQLSRALDYSITANFDQSDFYSFEVVGSYPLAIDLRSNTNNEVDFIVWDLDNSKKIAHFKETANVKTFVELTRGSYALEVQSNNSGEYSLSLQSGDISNLQDFSISINDEDLIKSVNRHVANGVSYFGGLYLGNYSPVSVGSVLKMADKNQRSSRSTTQLFTKLDIALPVTPRSNRSSEVTLESKYKDLFATIDALETYRDQYGSDAIDLSYQYYTMAIKPNDTYYKDGKMWDIDAINLPEAWELTKGSKDVIVAVIDTGVMRHVDLSTSDSDATGQLIAGYDFIDNDSNPIVSSGNVHGGHVAGTIGAKANNGTGIVGMNWDVKIMPLRVCATRSCDGNAIYNAILYAAGLPNSSGKVPAQRADVINMSLGGPGASDFYNQAMTNALKAGTLSIVAAGNDNTRITRIGTPANGTENTNSGHNSGQPYSPASYSTAITVAAFTPAIKGASFTNYGAGVDIAAPGTEIYSTVLNNGYDGWQGTSMASPHVAGVAGLLKAMNLDLTAEQIRLYLTDKNLLTVPSGFDHNIHGEGFLNALKPLQKIADDFALFKPKLQVAPNSLYFANGNAYQDVAVLSKSSEQIDKLNYTVVYNNQEVDWLKIRRSDQFGVTPSRLGIYVDKMSFPSLGINSKTTLTADIFFTGDGVESLESVDPVTLPVTVEYDPNEEMHPVVTIQVVKDGSVVYTTYTGYDEGYYFSWPNEFTDGTIVAGSDLDNDGEICDEGEKYCGRLGGFLDASGGAIQNGSIHRIDVSFFEVSQGFIPVPRIENFLSNVVGGTVGMSLDLLTGPSVIIEALAKPTSSDIAPVVVSGLSGSNAQSVALQNGSAANTLLSSYATNLNLSWDSSNALPGFQGEVEFTLRVRLADGSHSLTKVTTLTIDNNSAPDLQQFNMTDLDYPGQNSYSGDVRIEFNAVDAESDFINLDLEYCFSNTNCNDDNNYIQAKAVTGLVKGIPANGAGIPHSVIWHSEFDLNAGSYVVAIRLRADDGKESDPSPLRIAGKTFTIDNVVREDGSHVPQAVHLDQASQSVFLSKFAYADLDGQGFFFGGKKNGGADAATAKVYILEMKELNTSLQIEFKHEYDLLDRRYGHTATSYNKKIYLFGGVSEDNGITNQIEVFDTTTNTSSVIAVDASIVARSEHTATRIGSKIYFIGGKDAQGNDLTNVTMYDITSNTWTEKAAMSAGRSEHSASEYGGFVFVYGGKQSETILSTLDNYNPVTNTWTTNLASFAEQDVVADKRYSHTGNVVNGKLHIWGGLNDVDSAVSSSSKLSLMYIFDFQTLKWSEQQANWYNEATGGKTVLTPETNYALNNTRYDHGAVLYASHIYYYGGRTFGAQTPASTDDDLSTAYKYRPPTNVLPSFGFSRSQELTFSATSSISLDVLMNRTSDTNTTLEVIVLDDTTAVLNEDYTLSGVGALTYTAGVETSKTVTISIKGNENLVEDRIIRLQITKPDGAYLAGTKTYTLTIKKPVKAF